MTLSQVSRVEDVTREGGLPSTPSDVAWITRTSTAGADTRVRLVQGVRPDMTKDPPDFQRPKSLQYTTIPLVGDLNVTGVAKMFADTTSWGHCVFCLQHAEGVGCRCFSLRRGIRHRHLREGHGDGLKWSGEKIIYLFHIEVLV